MISKDIIEQIKLKLFNPSEYCLTELGVWLVSIILNNNKYNERIEDWGFDVSTYPEKTDEKYDLSKYKTVEEFLSNEFTGNTKATYISGHGIAAETLLEEGYNVINEIWFDFIEKNYQMLELKKDGFMDEDVYDELWSNGVADVDVFGFFCNMNLNDCFNRYLLETIDVRNSNKIKN